jgi:catechol 2,3-dioxygenase-like lactoylglutathione lyase family enzyme
MIKAFGIAHATLTVSDIKRTKKFYEDLFESKIGSDDEFSFSLLEVGAPCWFIQYSKNKNKVDRFDETRVGLDHIAFELKEISELKKVVKNLGKMNVKTVGLEYFADKYPYVCFRDPDNIQVEFFISNP